jgi:hypothetical protein
LGKSVRRVHVTGSIVWSNKKDFDLVQSRLEPRPFVCSSQLPPEIANARYEAFRSAGDPTIGRELITQGRLLATMLPGIANFKRGLIRDPRRKRHLSPEALASLERAKTLLASPLTAKH